jgi:hypothetical protein
MDSWLIDWFGNFHHYKNVVILSCQFIEKSTTYADMFITIGACLVASSPLPDRPTVEAKERAAVAVSWLMVGKTAITLAKHC